MIRFIIVTVIGSAEVSGKNRMRKEPLKLRINLRYLESYCEDPDGNTVIEDYNGKIFIISESVKELDFLIGEVMSVEEL
jgi:uncharacterized protein YlzI (FlbEa/FlbD family)